MVKREVVYTEFVRGEEHEFCEVLRFTYTPRAIRTYEQETGRDFFKDYDAALRAYGEMVKEVDIKAIGSIGEDEETKAKGKKNAAMELDSIREAIGALPILSIPEINRFLLDFVPCMYAKVRDGELLQSEETHDEAKTAGWLLPIIQQNFFTAVFGEISGRKSKKKLPEERDEASR